MGRRITNPVQWPFGQPSTAPFGRIGLGAASSRSSFAGDSAKLLATAYVILAEVVSSAGADPARIRRFQTFWNQRSSRWAAEGLYDTTGAPGVLAVDGRWGTRTAAVMSWVLGHPIPVDRAALGVADIGLDLREDRAGGRRHPVEPRPGPVRRYGHRPPAY
jgi:hypothetical protein